MLTSPFDYRDADLYPERLISGLFLTALITVFISGATVFVLPLVFGIRRDNPITLPVLVTLLAIIGFSVAIAHMLNNANRREIAGIAQRWVNQQYTLPITPDQALTLLEPSDDSGVYGTIRLNEHGKMTAYTLTYTSKSGYKLTAVTLP